MLQEGDTVIEDFKLTGTRVKNFRQLDGVLDIECKIAGFGAQGLKTEFVRKA